MPVHLHHAEPAGRHTPSDQGLVTRRLPPHRECGSGKATTAAAGCSYATANAGKRRRPRNLAQHSLVSVIEKQGNQLHDGTRQRHGGHRGSGRECRAASKQGHSSGRPHRRRHMARIVHLILISTSFSAAQAHLQLKKDPCTASALHPHRESVLHMHRSIPGARRRRPASLDV